MEIPETVAGLPVAVVSNSAFRGRVDIESVKFNPSMRRLEYRAFAECKFLKEVDYSAVTVSMKAEGKTFESCERIENLVIPEGCAGEFDYCTGLKTVVFTGMPNEVSFGSCTSLESVTFHNSMTEVGGFRDCTSLTSVTIPASVRRIKPSAFKNATSLSSVTFAEGSTLDWIEGSAFEACPITELELPECVQFADVGSFSGTLLSEIRLPLAMQANVTPKYAEGNWNPATTVPNTAFDGPNMRKIVYNSMDQVLDVPPSIDPYKGLGRILDRAGGENIEVYINEAPLETLSIPGTKVLPGAAFASIGTLKHVVFENSNGTNTFGFTFNNCKNLETVEIGAGAPYFSNTFPDCVSLKSVVVSPKNRTEKLSGAFSHCTALESIEFPYVTEISYAFKDCTSLKQVNFPELKTIKSYECFQNCTSLETVNAPKVESIGGYCFDGCTSLKEVYFPEVTEIESGLFRGCSSLESVKMPKCTQITGEGNFSGDTMLKEVILGEVNYVPREAFRDCTSLEQFDFHEGMTLGLYAFANTGFKELNLKGLIFEGYSPAPFYGCTKVERLTVEDITENGKEGKLSFYGLTALKEMTVNGIVSQINLSGSMKDVEDGRLIINADVPEIRLNGNTGLARIEFNGENGFEQGSFEKLTGLKEVCFRSFDAFLNGKYESGQLVLGSQAPLGGLDLIINGEKVTDLQIPAGTQIVDNQYMHMSMGKVTFLEGEGNITVGHEAFIDCSNLQEVEFSGNVSYIGNSAFAGTSLSFVEVPASVTEIGTGVFQRNEKLTDVVLSPSLIGLPSGTVYNTPALQQFLMPEGIEWMGQRVINGHFSKEIKTISIPSTMTILSMINGVPTFENIPVNVDVYSWAAVPPESASPCFANSTVHVPVGCGQAYRNHAQWTNANIVEDLRTGYKLDTANGSVTFIFPKNGHIAENVQVVRYVIEYRAKGSEETWQSETFEREIAAVQSRTADDDWHCALTGLAEYTEYEFSVKGYAQNGTVMFKATAEASTGEFSGVEEIEAGATGADRIYDLQGRRVSKPSRGLYIVNGRKTVVK